MFGASVIHSSHAIQAATQQERVVSEILSKLIEQESCQEKYSTFKKKL